MKYGPSVSQKLALFTSLFLVAWAIYIHMYFIRAVPDPVFHPDSQGYTLPAFNLLFGHPFDLPSHRTPAYPLFLYLALKTTGNFFGVLFFQHVLALLTGGCAAFIYYRYIRPSILGAVLVFFFSTALPIPAIYAHCILTETLYTFFLVGCILLFFMNQENQATGRGLATGLVAALAVLTRPMGRAVLGVLLIAPFFKPGRRHWIQNLLGGLGALGLLFAFSLWNVSHNGFLGIDRIGGMALFGTTARYLDLDVIREPKLRQVLEPIYQRDAAKFKDGVWVCGAPDGPLYALMSLYEPNHLDHVLKALAFQAIYHHPIRFLYDRMLMFIEFFWRDSEIPQIYLNREYTFFVYRGLTIYAQMARSYPSVWGLLRYEPREAAAYYARIRPIAMGQIEDAETYLTQIDQQDVYHYDRVLRAWWPLKTFFGLMRWLPSIALFLSVYLWRSKSARYYIAILWAVIGLHAALSTLATGLDPRYTVPLLPFYWILAIGGIQASSVHLKPLIRFRSPVNLK